MPISKDDEPELKWRTSLLKKQNIKNLMAKGCLKIGHLENLKAFPLLDVDLEPLNLDSC